MKKFALIIMATTFTLILWYIYGSFKIDENKYYSNDVLDRSLPLNVSIDVDFVKSLDPAYE